jgi:hypothetical protein
MPTTAEYSEKCSLLNYMYSELKKRIADERHAVFVYSDLSRLAKKYNLSGVLVATVESASVDSSKHEKELNELIDIIERAIDKCEVEWSEQVKKEDAGD